MDNTRALLFLCSVTCVLARRIPLFKLPCSTYLYLNGVLVQRFATSKSQATSVFITETKSSKSAFHDFMQFSKTTFSGELKSGTEACFLTLCIFSTGLRND